MPIPMPDDRRVALLEGRIHALEQNVRELQSERDRRRDQATHEWRVMLDGAVRLLTEQVHAQIASLKPLMDRAHMLDDVQRELALARDERLARREREMATDALIAQRKADHKRRLVVGGLLVPLVVAVISAITAAIASHQ